MEKKVAELVGEDMAHAETNKDEITKLTGQIKKLMDDGTSLKEYIEEIESKKSSVVFYDKLPFEATTQNFSREDIVEPAYVAMMDAESKKQYEDILNHFTCIRCAKIVQNPLENIDSQRMICSKC